LRRLSMGGELSQRTALFDWDDTSRPPHVFGFTSECLWFGIDEAETLAQIQSEVRPSA